MRLIVITLYKCCKVAGLLKSARFVIAIMTATRPDKKFTNITQTSFVHHVQLGIHAEDIELCEKLCPTTIYDRILEEMEQKEKSIEGQLSSVES